jgi:hypothetical protein
MAHGATSLPLGLPSPARRRHAEADLQHDVMQYLGWALPADAIAHHSPGEGKRTKRAQGELKRSGYNPGWPDVLVIHRGRCFFIELKAARGVVSAAQRAMMGKLYYCGAEVVVCKGLREVQAALQHLGVPLKAVVAA